MKVYVVLESTRDTDYEYCGVYATREKAQQKIRETQDMTTRKLNLYVQEEEI